MRIRGKKKKMKRRKEDEQQDLFEITRQIAADKDNLR